jgi:hypothetical protein
MGRSKIEPEEKRQGVMVYPKLKTILSKGGKESIKKLIMKFLEGE